MGETTQDIDVGKGVLDRTLKGRAKKVKVDKCDINKRRCHRASEKCQQTKEAFHRMAKKYL